MKLTLATLLIFVLSCFLVAEMQVFEVVDANFLPVASVNNIYSPQNKTYNSNLLTLNVSVAYFVTKAEDRSITYSLDGAENITLTGTESSIDLCWKEINIATTLPALSEGSHRIDIYAQFSNPINFSTPHSRTVFFTIDTTNLAPTITSSQGPQPNTTITSATTTSTHPSPSPTQSLIELPYAAHNFYPACNSTDVALNTTVSISFSRPPSICNLTITPNVAIKERVFKTEGLGATYIFYFNEKLKPNTTYTTTVTYGQETAPEGAKSTTTRTWSFTTQTDTQTQQPTTSASTTPYFTVDYTARHIILILVTLAVVVSLLVYFKKRR